MANEVAAAERWLYGTLKNDETLTALGSRGVFGHTVPAKLDGVQIGPPYVFYTLPGGGNDVQTVEARRIWSELVYAVRYVAKVGSFVDLEAGAAAIDAALHRASGSNVSGVVVACVRQAPFAMIEIASDGFELRHLGGLYRLFVQ